ncbi:DUF1643 domain-containing protein [Peptostreptococcus stomatis]|uniref:DUF1643 domain-containing protein n=1 Tax=Peptostreptococcus stomatis TaxID=341694 RepID=UPI0024A7D001|nr:DUF1643 domain-containing protein [Peptostreptococcus stomatis]
MIIDTHTKNSIENSLAEYLNITIDELNKYINMVNNKSRDGIHFDGTIFEEEVSKIIDDLKPQRKIDDLYFYHLSRRINETGNYNTNNTSNNLKKLLLSESPISTFLKSHEITFIEKDGHPVLVYNNNIYNLDDTTDYRVCYLRKRLGYNNGWEDYCINGFVLRDQLMKNDYTGQLNRCPEIISSISSFLNKPEIQEDYYNKSTYFCYMYKLPISEIIFDEKDKLNDEEKVKYFVAGLFNRLADYKKNSAYISDDDNMIVRTRYDASISIESFIDKVEITKDMKNNSLNYDGSKWIYYPEFYTQYRYVLGTKGNKPIIVIGINPSTAGPNDLDNTMKSVDRLASYNGYDSYIMLNVYAQRATNPSDMDMILNKKLHKENRKAFKWVFKNIFYKLKSEPIIWAAWGTNIYKRSYLKGCLKDIVALSKSFNSKWYNAGELTEKGHPRHPLYLPKDTRFEPFDIDSYIKNL